MIKLFTDFLYPIELQDVAKLFYVDVYLCSSKDEADVIVEEKGDPFLYTYRAVFGDKFVTETVSTSGCDELQSLRLRKRFAKISLYRLLSDVTVRSMPWGSLTGIRPTKLARQLVAEGQGDWRNYFTDTLDVSLSKTQLVSDILKTQGNLAERRPDCADLYIGIPFCVSRCSYCSFTSGEIDRLKQYVDHYVDALCRDISDTIIFAEDTGIKLENVYFGGGTPTSLSAEHLDKILDKIAFKPQEYTVEAGRPDTITAEKLAVLKKHGVNRISINPQTFNQSVLDIIGRKHSVRDIYEKYDLANRYGFTVNMDLIAGLPSETAEMFQYSVDSAMALAPSNITVHTLALKHGSVLKERKYAADADVVSMIEYSRDTLYSHGYVPYYMYRQKYVMDNLENVGYCKDNTPCLYNIGIMEETSNILACGANAISKRVIKDQNRIERAANAKDVVTYIARIDDYLEKKFKLFGNDK